MIHQKVKESTYNFWLEIASSTSFATSPFFSCIDSHLFFCKYKTDPFGQAFSDLMLKVLAKLCFLWPLPWEEILSKPKGLYFFLAVFVLDHFHLVDVFVLACCLLSIVSVHLCTLFLLLFFNKLVVNLFTFIKKNFTTVLNQVYGSIGL